MSKKILILDLDETLIHSTTEKTSNFNFSINLDEEEYFVHIRPNLDIFLDFCFKHFEVFIWTSSVKEYAFLILEKIIPKNFNYTLLARDFFPNQKYISYSNIDDPTHSPRYVYQMVNMQKFWKQNISHLEGFTYIKPIKTFIKKYKKDIKDIICIDNDPYKFYSSYGNYWFIPSFFGNPSDNELKKLMPILKKLTKVEDVRVNKENF